MKTFIFLTFGFLGFAFYEMSGGADFEPLSAQMASENAKAEQEKVVVAEATTTPAKTVQAAEVVTTASITKIDSTPAVTRVSLNLTDLTAAKPEAKPQGEVTNAVQIIDSAETPQIILPSLIATTDNGTLSGDSEVRKVSGNRVNVRGGPSTKYGIVSKLTRGEEVRILEDNGNGWVRMQPVDGGKVGWMADFLLTSG